uniref:Serine hydrolase n=1 Tax=Streptomyces sp. NBC_00049 TaxID=2903617 RepID=A0AAU2K3B2_9ACTN
MTLLSDQADALIRALVESADPGALWAVGGTEGVHAGSDAGHAPVDVGGLTAVLALWPAIGSLVDEGALRLHTPLAAYGCTAADGIPRGTTAHHLLTHPGRTAALTLTRLAEHLTGSPLAELAATRVWHPLGMAGTRFVDGTLRAPLTDLVRFLRHLVAPAEPGGAGGAGGPGAPAGISLAWTAESLRIRTGELTPARGLLWHPAPHGVWTHPAPPDPGPALWISPQLHRWALLLPTGIHLPLRHAFREAVFAPSAPR